MTVNPLHILVLFPRYYWECKMSMARRRYIMAMQRREAERGDIKVTLTGQGWPDFGEAGGLICNVPRGTDAIMWYKPLGNPKDGVKPIAGPQKVVLPKIECFNEAYWPDRRAAREATEAGTTLVICHHRNDLEQFEHGPYDVQHIPHCADANLFVPHARPWAERDIPILVTGALDADIYPLRTRVAKLIEAGRLPGQVLRHPGYRLRSLEECLDQEERYAKILGRTKIAVACSSKHRYGLAKFVEGAMAGCALAGDANPDYLLIDTWFYNDLSMDADDEIVFRLSTALKHDEDLMRKADITHRSAKADFTTDHYVDWLLDCIRDHLETFPKGK